MLSRFFIDRPIFAWVIAIIIMLAGLVSIKNLPIEQYPDIAPTSVAINATYLGASATTLENSVTKVIEQGLIGIDHMLYFSSTSSSSGSATVTITFDYGVDPDIAQVQVQNKLQGIMPLLPAVVQQQGVSVTKSSSDLLLVVGFYSSDGKYSQASLGDFVTSQIQDEVARINGVGQVIVFGTQHAMRIWLNSYQMYKYNISADQIIAAIEVQNNDVSAGQLGGLPAVEGQELNATINVQSRLSTAKDFEDIILRVNSDGSQVNLKDVARVEVGSAGYNNIVRYNRKPASGIGVYLAAGSNAVAVADAVKAKIESLSDIIPDGVQVIYPLDTTPFIKISIEEVVKTLVVAIILVFFILFLFLQNFRATIIPTIAVPVVLLGTFGVLSVFGYSINTLTMFAMVLAIGLLVDDAIVVVENVERIISDEKLSPRDATRKSMDQITGALIGIAMVLSAVFVPMAFFGGSTGIIYRQFSVTIVSAMTLSVIVALILTPSLCATILKPHDPKVKPNKFFARFNQIFGHCTEVYTKSASMVISHNRKYFAIYGIIAIVLGVLLVRLPSSFLPDDDQGYMYALISTPSGSTSQRTLESIKKVEDYFLSKEAENLDGLFTVVGYSFMGSAQNTAIAFIKFSDWSKRTRPDQSVFAISKRAQKNLSQLKDARVIMAIPPPIKGLGSTSGFDLQLMDMLGLGHEALMKAQNELLEMASKDPRIVGVYPNGLADVPQFNLKIDNEKASALGVSIGDINSLLQNAWGSLYINNFIEDGVVKNVYLQADAPHRMLPENISDWYINNSSGQQVPIASFTSSNWGYGSPQLERYNSYSASEIIGSAAPGVSSGQAMEAIASLVTKLPKGFNYAWTNLSYQEMLSGSQGTLYVFSLLIVFLSLAALYESWSVPFSVMLVVPLGMIGAVALTLFTGHEDDVYFKVGLLTTIGLSSKNAILIVEFAKEKYEQGMGLLEAAALGARERFRPIIMTSMAFILGVAPLAVATGPGSASQNAIGVAVVGGMVAVTFLAIFFVPMFYVTVQSLSSRKAKAVVKVKIKEKKQ